MTFGSRPVSTMLDDCELTISTAVHNDNSIPYYNQGNALLHSLHCYM